MSKKAEDLAAEIVSVVASRMGVTKAAGGVAAMYAVVYPLAEIVVEQDKAIRRTSRKIRKNRKALHRMNAPAPGPWTPPRRGMVPMRPGEWNVKLTPAAQQRVNGHSHDPDDDDAQGDGPWHDMEGLS